MNKRTIMSQLTDFRVAVLATSGFEESELTEPGRHSGKPVPKLPSCRSSPAKSRAFITTWRKP
jgi:hypothetical protein